MIKIVHDKVIDKAWPFRGPCAFCGHPDARHGLWATLIGRLLAGDTWADVSSDNNCPIAALKRLLKVRPYQKEGTTRGNPL